MLYNNFVEDKILYYIPLKKSKLLEAQSLLFGHPCKLNCFENIEQTVKSTATIFV